VEMSPFALCAEIMYSRHRASSKALSTLSHKSATVAENDETTAKFGDCRTFLRQCGQGFKRSKSYRNLHTYSVLSQCVVHDVDNTSHHDAVCLTLERDVTRII